MSGWLASTPLSMTATLMLTPEVRLPSGVAAPDQALVAPVANG
jgi:hypothetical protein